MKLGNPSQVEIRPNAEKTEFLFRFHFPESPQLIEFSLDTDSTLLLMVALQKLQVRHRLPIPPDARPSGKPNLRVVTMDDDKR
jgi:hypothetical protein